MQQTRQTRPVWNTQSVALTTGSNHFKYKLIKFHTFLKIYKINYTHKFLFPLCVHRLCLMVVFFIFPTETLIVSVLLFVCFFLNHHIITKRLIKISRRLLWLYGKACKMPFNFMHWMSSLYVGVHNYIVISYGQNLEWNSI